MTEKNHAGYRDEPSPGPGQGPPVWELVIEDMEARDEHGRRIYGTPLRSHNGRNALVDAYQEALDLAVYLRQAIEEDRAARVALRDVEALPPIPEPPLTREMLVEFMHLARQEGIYDVERMIRIMRGREELTEGAPTDRILVRTTYREVLARIATLRDPEVKVHECSAADMEPAEVDERRRAAARKDLWP